MSKKRIKYIHIFIWLFAIFANLANFNFSGDMSLQHIVSYIFAFLYLMVVFYLFYSFLAPPFSLTGIRLQLFSPFHFS